MRGYASEVLQIAGKIRLEQNLGHDVPDIQKAPWEREWEEQT
jgi:hypothetical protein